jgi:hypothetical protein
MRRRQLEYLLAAVAHDGLTSAARTNGCFRLYPLFAGPPAILEWLYPNELFPTSIRASAVAVAAAVSRVGAAAVGTHPGASPPPSISESGKRCTPT